MSAMQFAAGPPQLVPRSLPAGLRPVGIGARVGARLLDGLLALAALGGLTWLAWSLLVREVLDISGLVGGVVFLIWLALGLWAVLGRGARLGGLILGQRWVILPDGQRAGWAVLAKLVAQAAMATITFGVGEPIISLTSMSPPLRRTWFDRITGVVLVTGAGAAPAHQRLYEQGRDAGHVRQVSLPDQVQPIVGPAMLASDSDLPSTRTPWLRLDDGTRIDLSTSVVIGRDPLLPPALPTGHRYPLHDPSMELSKTHLAVGAGRGGVWVVDLYSTNGVRVAAPGTAAKPIPSGTPVTVGFGHRIELGGRDLEVCGD